MTARRAVVAGAGVAGLSAALLLRRQGWEVELHEAAEAPGGLLRPVAFRGLDCDLGSHRLHPAALAEPLLAEIAHDAGLQVRPRHGRIVLGRRHLPYPLSLPGLLAGLGPKRAISFAGAALQARGPFAAWDRDRSRPLPADQGFEAFVLARAGRAAYEAFYRPYAEKVWGLDPREISQTAAKARVSTARPWRQLARAALPGPRATYLYPRHGMARLVGALHERARAAGVRVQLGRPLTDPGSLDADALIHAGQLRDLAPAPGLRHLGLHLVFLALPVSTLGEAETYYTPEGRYWFGRVAVVGNYSTALRQPGETALCVEIPEGRWGPHADFTRRVDELLEQLVHAGIVPPGVWPLEVAQRYVPDVYPLYVRDWHQPWQAAMAQVAALQRVLPVGRQGLFLHCNIDHAVAIGRAAVEHLAAGRDGRSWGEVARGFLGVVVRD